METIEILQKCDASLLKIDELLGQLIEELQELDAAEQVKKLKHEKANGIDRDQGR